MAPLLLVILFLLAAAAHVSTAFTITEPPTPFKWPIVGVSQIFIVFFLVYPLLSQKIYC